MNRYKTTPISDIISKQEYCAASYIIIQFSIIWQNKSFPLDADCSKGTKWHIPN